MGVFSHLWKSTKNDIEKTTKATTLNQPTVGWDSPIRLGFTRLALGRAGAGSTPPLRAGRRGVASGGPDLLGSALGSRSRFPELAARRPLGASDQASGLSARWKWQGMVPGGRLTAARVGNNLAVFDGFWMFVFFKDPDFP